MALKVVKKPAVPMPRVQWFSAEGDATGYDGPGHAWEEGLCYAFAVYDESDQQDVHWSGMVFPDADESFTGWSVMSPGKDGDPMNRYVQKVHGRIETENGQRFLVVFWLSNGKNKKLKQFRSHTEYARIPVV